MLIIKILYHRATIWALIPVLTLTVLSGCGRKIENVENLHTGIGRSIIVFGNSIAAGYGVPEDKSFPALLARKLGIPILNRGVSGDTTAMALRRLEKDVLEENPWMVIIELGGNDFLNKVPKEETEANLIQIIEAIQRKGAIAVLLGMNMGLFVDEYREIYQRVAERTGAYLIPEVLNGILDNPAYRQEDFIHPNEAGHEKLADRVAKELRPLLMKATWPPELLRYRTF